MEEGRATDAIAALDKCLEKKPDWMVASILRGKCLLSLDRKEEAKSELQRSLQLAIDQHHETPEAEVRKLLAGL